MEGRDMNGSKFVHTLGGTVIGFFYMCLWRIIPDKIYYFLFGISRCEQLGFDNHFFYSNYSNKFFILVSTHTLAIVVISYRDYIVRIIVYWNFADSAQCIHQIVNEIVTTLKQLDAALV